jgi:agmatinase
MERWFDIPEPWSDPERARVVIIPAPYEGTVSYGKGASQGPAAIQAASHYLENYDLHLGWEPYRCGICGRPALTLAEAPGPAEALSVVETAVKAELDAGRHPVLVGGEHSLTVGAVRACQKRWPDLTVLQLDAHADLRARFEGTPFSHACVMRRVAELGVEFVQAGVRSMSREERQWLEERGRGVMTAREVLRDPGWINRLLTSLSEHVYFTLDLDVLDPAEMPATGCPEPGGISYHHVVDLALALASSGKRVVGLDMMELAPLPGLHYPDVLAASLLYTFIGACFPPRPLSQE